MAFLGKFITFYINYNESIKALPKIWACNPEGDLFFGSINKTPSYQSKDTSYFATTAPKKVREGYHDLGVFEIGVLNDLKSLSSLLVGRPNMPDIERIKSNPVLATLMGRVVANDVNGIVTSTLNRMMVQHGINVSKIKASASSSSQAQPANPKPKKRKPKIPQVLNTAASKKSDTAWGW